jgi:predicted  nucleic acid-binding Zn-ribbon protein
LHPQLADLIALQKIDSAIQGEEREIAALPAALAAADARIQEHQDRLDGRKQQLDEAQKDRRKLEGELQAINEKLSKYHSQLMEVKTNEAYRAMQKEIETTKAEIAAHEERILVDMLSVDDLEAEIKELEKRFQADKAELEKEKAGLEESGRQAEERLRVHKEERQRLAHGLDPAALSTYQKVAKMRGGVGVAQVREELCLGCRVKVRPQVFEEVRTGQELHTCDSCGRFLYYVEEFAEEASKAPQAPGEPAPAPPGPDEPTS